MKKLLVLVVVFILGGVATWAQSTIGSGQWLHDCWVQEKVFAAEQNSLSAVTLQAGMFRGCVVGVALMASREETVSIPDDASFAQIASVVGNYLDAHPEQWNYSAAQLVVEALHAVWPGKKTPGQ